MPCRFFCLLSIFYHLPFFKCPFLKDILINNFIGYAFFLSGQKFPFFKAFKKLPIR